MMTALKRLNAARSINTDIINWRRHLHQIPEIGQSLPKTVAYVSSVLTSLGIEHDRHFVNGNGIVATIKGTKTPNTSRVLAIRADMDGLPIQEETNLPFQSTNQYMHACGHDGHTAVLLGTAALLSTHTDHFSGAVKLIFQPAEEGPGGAQPMIDEGVLHNPTVTRIIGVHQGAISSEPTTALFNVKSGPLMASADVFTITITGVGYHGAYPEFSQDPIVAASQLITAIQTIKSRHISATQPSVISITSVTGGSNHNIIPCQVTLEGTVRTLDESVRQDIKQHLARICAGIGSALNVHCHLDYTDMYPVLVNDDVVTTETAHALTQLFGDTHVHHLTQPLMGGEDMACFLHEVPGTYFFMHNPGLIDGIFHGHHHPKFDIDESKLHLCTAAFVHIALDYLS